MINKVNSLQEKLDTLYKNKDLSKDDDKRLLKNERASLQYQDPEFRAEWEAKDKEARAKKEANPEFRKQRIERNKKLATNTKRNKSISESVSAQWADLDYKQQRVKNHRKVTSTKEFKEAHAEGINTREANGWEEKNAEAAKKRRKTIQTPYGIFESKGAAVEAMTSLGIGNAGGKLSAWLNTKKDEYFYIKE